MIAGVLFGVLCLLIIARIGKEISDAIKEGLEGVEFHININTKDFVKALDEFVEKNNLQK